MYTILIVLAVLAVAAAGKIYHTDRKTTKLRKNPKPGEWCRVYNADSSWDRHIIVRIGSYGVLHTQNVDNGHIYKVHVSEIYSL